MDRKEQLQRLIMGLEMSIPDFQGRLEYYEPDDLEGKYARKFLAAMEENLEKARKELAELELRDGGGVPG